MRWPRWFSDPDAAEELQVARFVDAFGAFDISGGASLLAGGFERDKTAVFS